MSLENPDLGKNMHLLKNPYFLSNHRETLSKWLSKNCGFFDKSIFFHVHFFASDLMNSPSFPSRPLFFPQLYNPYGSATIHIHGDFDDFIESKKYKFECFLMISNNHHDTYINNSGSVSHLMRSSVWDVSFGYLSC